MPTFAITCFYPQNALRALCPLCVAAFAACSRRAFACPLLLQHVGSSHVTQPEGCHRMYSTVLPNPHNSWDGSKLIAIAAGKCLWAEGEVRARLCLQKPYPSSFRLYLLISCSNTALIFLYATYVPATSFLCSKHCSLSAPRPFNFSTTHPQWHEIP